MEGDCPAHSGTGSLLHSQAGSLFSKAHSRPHGSLRAYEGGLGDQERQAGGVLWEEQERSRGRLPYPLKPREPAGLPGEAPAL